MAAIVSAACHMSLQKSLDSILPFSYTPARKIGMIRDAMNSLIDNSRALWILSVGLPRCMVDAHRRG